jgi:ABC-type methionine transport system permease subunit
MLCSLLFSMLAFLVVHSLGIGTMHGDMGAGGGLGHFNPAFMQGGQQFNQMVPDGPRKRYRADESG